jgi:hypothetical protein
MIMKQIVYINFETKILKFGLLLPTVRLCLPVLLNAVTFPGVPTWHFSSLVNQG